MTLETLRQDLSVCKLASVEDIDLTGELFFVGRTDGEISLVCLTEDVPSGVLAREDGWRAFRVRGPLDFSLIGILAGISTALAEAGIGIFVVSTFDTDYVLVKGSDQERALDALSRAGYGIVEGGVSV